MGRLAAALLSLAIAIPAAQAAPRERAPARHAPARHGPAAAQAKRAKGGGLPEAVAAMKALMRDRERRRYHHNWERGIAAILASARGRDAQQGFLEASRARYALYRWSANEADRDKALSLAKRAARLGSREAKALADAIRHEAGDDTAEVAHAQHPADRRGKGKAGAEPREKRPVEKAPAEAEEEDSPPDPELAAALADLAEPATAPALKLGESEAEAGAPAEITDVRSWSDGDYSRVAVYLSHWAGWQKRELPAEGGQPRRLAFDFRPARLAGSARTRAVGGGRIDRVRAAQNDADTVRVVLDLPGNDAVEVFALHDPPRLVVDVGSRPPPAHVAEEEGRPAAEGKKEAGGAARAAPGEARAAGEGEEGGRRRVRKIVVDAGHGGHDPGATGPRGLREKDVTLSIARRVAKDLKRAGFEVVLTRSSDTYLALEERTALANTARADLFVSVHANAHPRRNRSGIETYFLNVTDDRYAARLAARENGMDLDDDGGEAGLARRIRVDLEAKASASTSRLLAEMVQREVCRAVQARFGEVRDLGVKSALFYVLLGARMPAVLVETGFISNRDEERRLASGAYQDEVARSITQAVREYAGGDARVAAAR